MEWIIVIVGCLIGSAFFSGSETALLRLREGEIHEDAPGSSGPAIHAIRELLDSTSRLLVTILVGNNVVNILGASVASAAAVALLGPGLGVALATVVMTILILVFCEILPKAVAAAHPQGVARAVALPLYLLHQCLRPVHAAFDRVIEPLVHRITGGRSGDTPLSSEELVRFARSARQASGGEGPVAIMGRAAEAASRTAEEIMVPRTEIVAFPVETAPAELLQRMLEERYTRVPILEGSIDHVLGIAHFKDVVKYVQDSGNDLRAILKPVLRVPLRKPIFLLLGEMQRYFIHLAVVKDANGVTQGLLTQEDILEEVVGEIRDEFDEEELEVLRRVGDAEFESLGRVTLLDFQRQTGWHIPGEPGDSLSAAVFNALGRAPSAGDQVRAGNYEIDVSEVSGLRIARVRVRQLPEGEPEE